jgi:hypothetical protein
MSRLFVRCFRFRLSHIRLFMSIGFRSHSHSSSIQTTSLVGFLSHTDVSTCITHVPIESTKLTYHISDNMILSSKQTERNELQSDGHIRVNIDQSKRANVIKEIYKTEHDYLGHLKNLVDVNSTIILVNERILS